MNYQEVCLKDYASVPEGRGGLENYFVFYNHERPHWALTYRTRAETCGEAPGMLLAGARRGC